MKSTITLNAHQIAQLLQWAEDRQNNGYVDSQLAHELLDDIAHEIKDQIDE